MKPNLAAIAHLRTPRYTSYPTAPHFHDGVTPELVAGWLGGLPRAAPLSLYLHVPFCRKVCWYCACNMKLAARPEPVLDYAEWLMREIALVARLLPGRMPVVTLHWGGGTPTAMPMPAMARVMDRLRQHFDLRADAEIAVEIDPRTFSAEMAPALAAMGFTRASLGVQEFDPRVQAAVNRIQPFDKVRDCVAALRDSGIAAISFDLIHGLPHQSTATIARSIELSLALAPDRVALFGYAHVPWMAKNQRLIPADALPGPEARHAQAHLAARLLVEAGYLPIGLDHFARPGDAMARAAAEGRLRRNFQGYTVDPAEALIGFGSTAISSLPQGHAQALPEPRGWKRAIAEGRLPVRRGFALSAEDRLRGRVIERLMCDLSVDFGALALAHGRPADHFAAEATRLQALSREGLCRVEGSRVTVPAEARPALRVVASVFDAYLEPDQATPRHAAAI